MGHPVVVYYDITQELLDILQASSFYSRWMIESCEVGFSSVQSKKSLKIPEMTNTVLVSKVFYKKTEHLSDLSVYI